MLTKEEMLARAKQPSEEALRLHLAYHGKIQVVYSIIQPVLYDII